MNQYEVTVSSTKLYEPQSTDLILYFPKKTKVVKIFSVTVNNRNEMLNYFIVKDDSYVKIATFNSLKGGYLVNCKKGILKLKCILQSSSIIGSKDLMGTVTYEKKKKGFIDGRINESACVKIRKLV